MQHVLTGCHVLHRLLWPLSAPQLASAQRVLPLPMMHSVFIAVFMLAGALPPQVRVPYGYLSAAR